jgi:hypothetical protein
MRAGSGSGWGGRIACAGLNLICTIGGRQFVLWVAGFALLWCWCSGGEWDGMGMDGTGVFDSDFIFAFSKGRERKGGMFV